MDGSKPKPERENQKKGVYKGRSDEAVVLFSQKKFWTILGC